MLRFHTVWTSKHKPKCLTEIVGNSEAIHAFTEWIKSWQKAIPKKRAAFLYGPPGIGKTLTIETVARELGMELVEKNASDYRTEDAVQRFAGLASQFGSLTGESRIILLDEVDGLTGAADRGGVKAMTEVIRTSRNPIVLTANDVYDPKFATLRLYCLLIEFKKPPTGDVLKHLKRIAESEAILSGEGALTFLAQRSEGDVRSAVNDFQALAEGKKRIDYEDVSWLGYRDRQDSIFNVLRMIIYGKTAVGAKRAADMADVDTDMLFEWIYENVPVHLTDSHDLAKAMDALAIADLYRGRIRKTREWSLMRYVIDFMTAGVALARAKSKAAGWVPFKFPQRIQMLSRSKMERAMLLSIGRKIKAKSHISAVRASKYIVPYLQIIFKNDPDMAAGTARWLELDDDMIFQLANNEQKATEISKRMAS